MNQYTPTLAVLAAAPDNQIVNDLANEMGYEELK